MKKILALTAGMLLVASTSFARYIDTGTIELSGSSNGFYSSRSGDGTSENALNLDRGRSLLRDAEHRRRRSVRLLHLRR